MINPIKITFCIKNFSINSDRLDVWVTEAIKVSSTAKQELIDTNLSLSRSRVKKLIEGNNIKIDGIGIIDPSFKIKNNKVITIQLPPADAPVPLAEKISLEILYPRLVSGGVLIIDDYGHFKGAKIAVDNFFKDKKNIWMHRVDYTCRLIIKS